MGLHYKNLDAITRGHMLKEDAAGGHYASPRIVDGRLPEWLTLFRQALEHHNDDWLATEANARGLMKHEETRRMQSGKIVVAKVPHNAAQQLAEGEFNRYYLRGIAARALAEGRTHLKVYRGKEVSVPRADSEAKLGALVAASVLLTELRSNDFVDNALGLPPGPNSGLTAEMA